MSDTHVCPYCTKGQNSPERGGTPNCFHCDTCSFVACEEEPGALQAKVTELQIQLDAWKTAVLDAAIVDWVYTAEHETNPRKAINDLLAHQITLALDPAVSADAKAWQDRLVAAEDERDKAVNMLTELRLIKAGPTKDGQAFEAQLQAPIISAIASALTADFKERGGVNYVEYHFVSSDPAIGPFFMTMQRVLGKTPNQLQREAMAERDRLLDRERHFAEVLGVADGGQYRADWDARIRAVLDRMTKAETELAILKRPGIEPRGDGYGENF
jgi:hypothetical protein